MSQILYLTVVSSFPTPVLTSVNYDNSTGMLMYHQKGNILNEKASTLVLHHTESNNKKEIPLLSNITKILPNHRFKKYEHIPDNMPIYYQINAVLSGNVIVYKNTSDGSTLSTFFQTPNEIYCVHPETGDYATYYYGDVKIYQNVDYWSNSCKKIEINLPEKIPSFGIQLLPNGELKVPRILLFSREKLNYYEGDKLVMEVKTPFTDDCQVAMDTKMGILFMANSHKILALDFNKKFETLFEIDIKFFLVRGLAVDMERKQLFVGSKNFIHIFNYGYFDKHTVDSLQGLLQEFSKEYMVKNKGGDYEESVRSYFRKMYNESNMNGTAPSRPSGYTGGYCAIIPQLSPYVNQKNQPNVAGAIQQQPQPVVAVQQQPQQPPQQPQPVVKSQEQPRSTPPTNQTQNNQIMDCCIIL